MNSSLTSFAKKRAIFVAVFGLIAAAVSQNVSNAYQYPSTVSNYNYRIFVPATAAPAPKALIAAPTLSMASVVYDTATASVTPTGPATYVLGTPVSFNLNIVANPPSATVNSFLAATCSYSPGGAMAPTALGNYSVICSGPSTSTQFDDNSNTDLYTITYGTYNFSIVAPSHTVTFNPNGGTGTMAPQSANTSTTLTPNAFTIPGYSFGNWNTRSTGLGTPHGNGETFDFASDLNLFAQWTANTLNVTFDSQGGSAVTGGSTTTGGTVANPGDSSRSCYPFNGWFTAPSGGSRISFPYTHGQTTNFTLYAQWGSYSCNTNPGPSFSVVPNIVDKTKADATTALNRAGFALGTSKGTTTEGATSDNDGKISWQSLTGTQVIEQSVDYKTYAYTPKDPAAAIVLPLAPAPAPAPVQEFGTTAVQIDKYALYKSIVDVAGNTKLVVIAHDSGTALKLTNGVEASLSAKLKLNLTNDGVQVTSIAGWTGHIAFPVVATVNGKVVELYIGVEEDPAPVAKPLFNLVNLKSAKISWSPSTSQVTYYNVYFGTKLVCNTSNNSCAVPATSISSLKSGLLIEAVGHESTYSTKVAPKYKTGAVAAAGIIHFANGSSTISASDKKSLDALVKSLKKLGVTAIQINGHADVTGSGSANTKLAIARGNAVKAYIAKQLPKVKINVKGYSSKVPAASTKTAAGLASSRRAEILVG